MFSLSSAAFFSKLTFSKNVYDTSSLGPDQDRPSDDPDLGPNCLQRLSADDKSPYYPYSILEIMITIIY